MHLMYWEIIQDDSDAQKTFISKLKTNACIETWTFLDLNFIVSFNLFFTIRNCINIQYNNMKFLLYIGLIGIILLYISGIFIIIIDYFYLQIGKYYY
jgi:hypothetical protein